MLRALLDGTGSRVVYEHVEDASQLKEIAAKLKPGTVNELVFAGHGSHATLRLGPTLVFRKDDHYQLEGARKAEGACWKFAPRDAVPR